VAKKIVWQSNAVVLDVVCGVTSPIICSVSKDCTSAGDSKCFTYYVAGVLHDREHRSAVAKIASDQRSFIFRDLSLKGQELAAPLLELNLRNKKPEDAERSDDVQLLFILMSVT
jgi:hypothetical protein